MINTCGQPDGQRAASGRRDVVHGRPLPHLPVCGGAGQAAASGCRDPPGGGSDGVSSGERGVWYHAHYA